MELYWLMQAVAYWSLCVFLIPLRYIGKFLPYAFLGGFVYTWSVQIIAVDFLELWYYKPDIFTFLGIPVFFTISWFGVTLIYGFLLYKYPRNQLWIIIFFVLWATAMCIIADNLKLVFMPNWSIPETLMFAVFSHVLLLYVLKFWYHVEELGARENIIGFSLSLLKNKRP